MTNLLVCATNLLVCTGLRAYPGNWGAFVKSEWTGGSTGHCYIVQASADLVAWRTVVSAPGGLGIRWPTNGVLDLPPFPLDGRAGFLRGIEVCCK